MSECQAGSQVKRTIDHPLHGAIGKELERLLQGGIIRDPACGGTQCIPLFIGEKKSSDVQMCDVDALLIVNDQIRAILEIEESPSKYLPTTICGKFFQCILATHFIHESHTNLPLPYAEDVLFVQVIDSSKLPKSGSKKDQQFRLIEKEISRMLPAINGSIKSYRLLLVNGPDDGAGIAEVCKSIASALD